MSTSSVGFQRSNRLRKVLILGTFLTILTILLTFYLLTIYWMSDYPSGSDFAKFYHSGRALLDGKDIYQPIPVEAFAIQTAEPGNVLHPNLNPPFVTMLLAPLGLLSYPTAFLIWAILSLASGLFAIHLVQKNLSPKFSMPTILGNHILLLAYFPTWVSIIYGQFSLLLFLLLALAWRGLRLGRDVQAGIVLGSAISIKLFAGLFLLFLAVRGEWRALAWTFATIVAWFLSSLLVFTPETYLRYIEILGEVTWQSASWNASFQGFFTRIFGGSENTPLVPSPAIGQFFIWGCSLALLLGLFFFTRKGARRTNPVYIDTGFALWCAAMLLLSPLGWVYYFPVLWIPFAVGWNYCPAPSHKTRAFLVASWALSTLPHLLIPSPEIHGAWQILFLSGSYSYALVLLVLIFLVVFPPVTDPARDPG